MKKATTKAKIKYGLMCVLNIILSILPLIVLLIINWQEYSKLTEVNKVSTSIGTIGLIVFMALVLLKKTEFLKGILGWWLVTIIFFGLRFIVQDIVAISFCASLGMTLSKFITQPFVNSSKRKMLQTENAEITSSAFGEQLNTLVEAIKGSGRA